MENVQLDELVLQYCVNHMDLKSRMSQDIVSRKFANVLRSTNSSCEISLIIRQDEIVSATELSRLLNISVTFGVKRAEWKVIVPTAMPPPPELSTKSMQNSNTNNMNSSQLPTKSTGFLRNKLRKISNFLSPSMNMTTKNEIASAMHDIRLILLQIFFRFKRFRYLTLFPRSAWVRYTVDFMLETFCLKWYQPTIIKQIAYKPGGYCDAPSSKAFDIDRRDCRLVEMFAISLEKYMLLDGNIPEEGSDLSKRFWTAISTCSGLKKLYLGRVCEGPSLFLNNAELSECLKSLKIREFHTYGNNEWNLNVNWFVASFNHNMNLRKLCINPAGDTINEILSSPALLKIISRLHTVEIMFLSFKSFDNKTAIGIVRNIFRSLPERCVVNVEQLFDVHGTEIESGTVNSLTEALSFWLRLATESQKKIRLYVRGFNHRQNGVRITAAVSQQIMDELKNTEEFATIKIEQHSNHYILRFNNARIALYFSLLPWKPYLATEYVCQHHVD